MTTDEIRAAKAQNSTLRDRDLAASLDISEAQLVSAEIGNGVKRISADPDLIMPLVRSLGEVMALTRNNSCVHERVGTFLTYHSGQHASMVTGPDIDTRIFAHHWSYGFAVETTTDKGLRRSLQFFDAAGDAVQKIYVRESSNQDAWQPLVDALLLDDQNPTFDVIARAAVEPAKGNADKRDELLAKWAALTDSHQFNRIISRLGMNRLGAYHHASGEKWVRRLENTAVETCFNAISASRQNVTLFVGNRANIQIHWGRLETIKVMGPWLNVLDPMFNLHLRADHISETYVVVKPTKRGPAISIECFDAEGGLIFQCFGQRTDQDDLSQWAEILDALPTYLPVSS
jgi:putative hemin transport protein